MSSRKPYRWVEIQTRFTSGYPSTATMTIEAAEIDCLLVKIDTSMSCSTLADSTLAQLGEFGVKRLVLAAAAKMAGKPVLSEVRVVELGMTPPTVTIWVWNLVRPSGPTHSWARAWCWLLAETPRSEPPRNTGAV